MTDLATRTVADCPVPSAGVLVTVVLLVSRVSQVVFARPNLATAVDFALVGFALLLAIPIGITYADHRSEVSERE